MLVAERRRAPIRFAGYAAVFNHLDNGGDVIRPGAFAGTLKAGKAVPLLWQHRTGTVIGRIEALHEDDKGLRVIAEIGGGEPASQVAGMIRSERLNGLSFGYRVRRSQALEGVLELTELDLVEVSVVSRPMQPKALIHKVQ
jgi:HK97 family phage prohead protease